MRALRYSITPVVAATVCRIQISKNLADEARLDGSQPVCLMTVREEFDAFCLHQTIIAGAEFRRTSGITALRESPESVALSTSEGELRARFVIGADGVNSQVRRLIGEQSWFHPASR